MLIYIIYILSLSIDSFIAALSYQTNNIKIPFKSNLIISLTCSSSLLISLSLGNIIKNMINIHTLKWLSFFILFLLGITKIFNNNIKNILKRPNMNIINKIKLVSIYGDYKKADFDYSKNLSTFESLYLAFALSLDNIISGIAFNISHNKLLLIFVFSTLINIISISSTKIFRKITTIYRYLPVLFLSYLLFPK